MNKSVDYRYQQAPTSQQLGHLPGAYGLPFIGKTLSMFTGPIGTFHRHYLKFGPACSTTGA